MVSGVVRSTGMLTVQVVVRGTEVVMSNIVVRGIDMAMGKYGVRETDEGRHTGTGVLNIQVWYLVVLFVLY